MAEQDTDEMPWDGDSQPSEDAPLAADSTLSDTTTESSITKQRHSKSINANGPGRQHHGRGSTFDKLAEEIERLSKEKKSLVMKDKEPDHWKREIQQRMERELDQRVREALETPPLERLHRNQQRAKMRKKQLEKHDERNRSLSIDECNSYAQTLPSLRNQRPWNKTDGHFRYYDQSSDQSEPGIGCHDRDSKSRGREDSGKHRAPGAWGDMSPRQSRTTTEITKTIMQGQETQEGSDEESDEQRRISEIRRKTFHRYTAVGFKEALKQGKLKLKKLGNGRFMDKNGVILTLDGPFWPPEYGPLYAKPEHIYQGKPGKEPLSDAVPHDGRTVHTQRTTKWYRPWERPQVVFDSERTSKGTVPHTVPEGCSCSLVFESRFESGNLRQAKRIGQFEYDLVLKTDLYTNRHTQWYYFRVQRMIPGVTYKFNIVNLLKKDSLYNHGMRPLLYSEKEAEANNIGWGRTGHHISYTRSYGYNRNPLLHPEMIHYVLEWQMEFTHENDTCYFAHCYPYTFTDLKDHLDMLMSEPARHHCIRREVLCETRAGNSCFLLTVSNFSEKNSHINDKKAIVVSARVHPGETNASWMMKGLLDFITSSDPIAKQLRELFIFKIIPMLNPDGVIVGNYRCSLSARDLNRNYRHPKKESFPTVWHLKNMLQETLDDMEVVVYCDLHGHSRKHNVFIYGCDPQSKEGDAASFLYQRLFPWLMSQMAPDKFSFRGCKFRVKRCKEATGRVVMWRQMNIPNSFTMEATFCGAKNMESVEIPRHFNTSDFQDLGRHFCEALLEYHKAQQNKSLHSELILELTREITHQVLQSRGLLPASVTTDYNADDSNQGKKDPTAKGDEPNNSTKTTGHKPGSSKHDRKVSGDHASSHDGVRKIQSRLAALKMIDAMSSETIKGCIHILQDLRIIREFVESDTSDSDSASESEQPSAEPEEDMKQPKKKKKKRSRHKSRGVILPELRLPDDAESNKKMSSSGKFTHLKKYPPFVNRYINRSNGGIPMFSQERIDERAHKRVTTVHKIQKESHDDDAQYTEEEEYARLLAVTKHIQEQEAEVRYKMSPPAQQGHPMTYKNPFTHSNSFHGLQQTASSPHHLQPMGSGNPRNEAHPPRLSRSNTMIPSSNQGTLNHQSDHIIFLGNDHGYHGNELVNPIFDGNNNSLESTNAILTNELSGTVAMHHGKASRTNPYGFGKRTLTQLNLKPKSSNNLKHQLGRTSLSAAMSSNISNKSTSKSSASRHKTAPAGKLGAGRETPSVNRGHAADLISQQYGHFLSQTSKVPPSAAARYLESLTKSLSKSSPRPVLSLTKNTDVKESTEGKKLADLKAKTVF